MWIGKKGKSLGNLSFIVLANNSEMVIKKALESIKWAPEIIVVDTNRFGSSDLTVEIAKQYTSRVFWFKKGGFSEWRNWALKKATKDWIFYLDADESVTPELKKELLRISQKLFDTSGPGAYDVYRNNYFLGKKWHRGEWITRFFNREKIIEWRGELHETPLVKGPVGKLQGSINHWTHTDIESMIIKTLKWSRIEGYLLYKNNHPPMAGWRFIKVMLAELFRRLITEGYWRDGIEGWIEAIFQMFSVFLTYVRLWEYQTKRIRYKRVL